MHHLLSITSSNSTVMLGELPSSRGRSVTVFDILRKRSEREGDSATSIHHCILSLPFFLSYHSIAHRLEYHQNDTSASYPSPITCTRSGARRKTDDQVNKKRKITHPPQPTTANPPSLPSSVKPPFLPVEVLENILDKLHADKHTLAQCMRVNTTFNTITAPVLYRTVVFVSGKLSPYASTIRPPFARVTCPDQRGNIAYIKNIILHSRHPSWSELQFLARLSKVDSLRLPLHYLGPQMTNDQFLSECRAYRPGKLVIHCATTPRMAPNFSESSEPVTSLFDELHTLVFLTMPTFQAHDSLWASTTPPEMDNLERVICVMWANTPFSFSGLVPPDNPWKPAPRPELPTFCSAIPRLIAERHNIIEIVVVNGGGLYPSAVGLSFASTRAQRSAALQKVIATMVFEQLVELDPHTLIVEQTARLCIKYKNRNINVKFISIPDYLDNYDWSGELTADEVRPWLGNKIVQIKGPGLSEK